MTRAPGGSLRFHTALKPGAQSSCPQRRMTSKETLRAPARTISAATTAARPLAALATLTPEA